MGSTKNYIYRATERHLNLFAISNGLATRPLQRKVPLMFQNRGSIYLPINWTLGHVTPHFGNLSPPHAINTSIVLTAKHSLMKVALLNRGQISLETDIWRVFYYCITVIGQIISFLRGRLFQLHIWSRYVVFLSKFIIFEDFLRHEIPEHLVLLVF